MGWYFSTARTPKLGQWLYLVRALLNKVNNRIWNSTIIMTSNFGFLLLHRRASKVTFTSCSTLCPRVTSPLWWCHTSFCPFMAIGSLTFFTDRCQTQFYIQLVYKPHFGTWILLFGPFWQLWVEKKSLSCARHILPITSSFPTLAFFPKW